MNGQWAEITSILLLLCCCGSNPLFGSSNHLNLGLRLAFFIQTTRRSQALFLIYCLWFVLRNVICEPAQWWHMLQSLPGISSNPLIFASETRATSASIQWSSSWETGGLLQTTSLFILICLHKAYSVLGMYECASVCSNIHLHFYQVFSLQPTTPRVPWEEGQTVKPLRVTALWGESGSPSRPHHP